MGLSDFFDVISSLGFAEAHAEAPAEDNSTGSDSQDTETDESKSTGEEEGNTEGDEEEQGGEEQEAEADEGEEEEEEEEEEAVDIKPQLEEECANSSQCAPFKHHFDECVERVTRQEESGDHKGPKEDCVEEFFHLQHCATQCAAPKLWKQLK